MTKKITLASVIALLTFSDGFGQRSTVKLQIGYGIPLANTLLANSASSNGSAATYTGVYGSYGSGLRIEGGYIYSLNNHLAVELDGTYLLGKEVKAAYTSPTSTQTQSSNAHFYEVSPLLRVNFGGTKVRPYAGVGPVVGFGNLTSAFFSPGPNGSDVERQYSGSFALGAKSAVGAELTQGRFIFYVQATLIMMNYSPSQSAYTKYSLGGVDQLGSMSTYQKQVIYKRTITTGGTPDPDKPAEDLKFYSPLNSLSMDIGVMFKF